MSALKRYIKQNSHNGLFRFLASFGKAFIKLYENRNHDPLSNGEAMVLKKMASLDPKIIIDGGANIGEYSLLANSIMPMCKVYAFEPVQSTFQKLEHHTADCDNITTVNKGLYKEDCEKEIQLYPSELHSSLYDIQGISYSPYKMERIELVSGDMFVATNSIVHIDLLKMDIEGAEYDALLGFIKFIKNKKIRAIQFEYGYINITTKRLLSDFYNFFKDNGYAVGKIYPKHVDFRPFEFKHEDFIGPNYLAVSNTDSELIQLLSSK